MAGNDLMNQTAQLPAHIAAAFGVAAEVNTDLSQGVSAGYPIVSYKGKVWHIVEGGERQLVTNGADSDEPAPSLELVILRANPNLNKVYYPDGYEEGSNERPLCHSNDAIAPAADAQEPQSPKCATCKFNQFGSRITENGARGKACSDSRRLAIAPRGDLERAMLLRVPAASLKTMLAYAEGLTKRGAPYQALVTKVGFDHSVAYPSLTFKAIDWLTTEEVEKVKEMMDSDIVATITAINQTAHAEVAEKPEEKDDFLPPRREEPPKQTATRSAPKATPEEVKQAVGGDVTPKKATGFGGAATKPAETKPVEAFEEEQAPVSDKVEELGEGAMAELDAALAGFDD